ncbi:MAG: hypothetical protein H0X40_04660 [Chthoniobacterales bacterium]|nr:hypothetical protein [Chthoniobacterales bacterium]
MTARNSSGVVGVHPRTELIRKPSGKEYEYYYWVSRWPGCKLKAGVKWPIHKFGDDDAFVLAVLCRRWGTEIRDRVIAEFMDTVDAKRYKQILSLRRHEA